LTAAAPELSVEPDEEPDPDDEEVVDSVAG
jgi:hypothetical protein